MRASIRLREIRYHEMLIQTVHLDASKEADVARAANLLCEGELVAFATETVYGLGANALSMEAVERIFVAKQRPAWDPLIVHLASAEGLETVATVPEGVVERVAALVQAFWPGPLTLLLPRSEAVPDGVTAGRELVGVRVPAHPAALALLVAAGVPVAAPSANRFGHTSPTTAQHVLDDLGGRIAAVLDAGPTTIGVESTVLDPTQTPMVLYRPGAVSAEELTAVTGVAVRMFVPEPGAEPEALPSPGVGIRHYAPRAALRLTAGSQDALQTAVAQASGQIGVLLPVEWRIDGEAVVQPWGRWDDVASLAQRLFAGLRALDDLGVEVILCPLPEAGGLGDAVRDRLMKAARAD
jgi:L-threonylcarbamoyladenylate synthase